MKRLIVEVHRRSLWQVLGIYLAASWIGYQVILGITEGVGLPEWVPPLAIVLFIIGLPIVLATAFVQEGLPVGKPSSVDSQESTDGSQQTTVESPKSKVESNRGGIERLLTWRRAILGGIVALLLLAVTAGGYLGLRNAGVGPFGSLIASDVLERRERILLADFHSPDGDTLLADAVTEAFRVDFEQSPAVSVVDPSNVVRVLARMSRPAASRLEPELAREVAQRDGIKAVLLGEVRRAGTSHVLSARLVAAETGEALASYREAASDSTVILAAVDRLSGKLREKIGESLRSIHANQPLEDVSTPSLEALRKYSQGSRAVGAGDLTLGIQLLQEALTLDTTFAMAWRKLAVAYFNSNPAQRSDRLVAAASRAFEHRELLTDRERYHTVAFYHFNVTNDLTQTIGAYRALLETHPRDFAAQNNLALAYMALRDYASAAEASRRSVAIDSSVTVGHSNLAEALVNGGHPDEAEQVADGFEAQFGQRPPVYRLRFFLATSQGNDTAGARHIRRIRELSRGDPLWTVFVGSSEAELAALRGHLHVAEQHRANAAAVDRDRGNAWAPLQAQIWAARLDLLARQDPQRVLARLDDALRAHPLSQLAALDRPYLQVAEIYAVAGGAARARELVSEYEKEVDPTLRGNDRARLARIRAAAALSEGRFEVALNELRSALEGPDPSRPCYGCRMSAIARAFEGAGHPDSAIVWLERYVSTPASRRIWFDAIELGPNYESLSRLYDVSGDREKAARYAAKFVDLWKDADPELQPRVQAARRRLERLEGTG